MQLNPYLLFNGQCEEAFKFYEQVLGGKIEALNTRAGLPAEGGVPPEWRDKVLHAYMTIGDTVLMASDAPPGNYAQPKGMYISIRVKETAEAERIFHALAENGTVQMPIAETFFSPRFGMLIDQFGIPWMVNCERAA
ncbi:MAG TPA: VOC family protein [Pyrinomonadaceae bacterium]|nr:VOC family protein [Pyrinomonadaceae bacterium]